mmetsp:Transcript_9481/g.11353  ORF Transcript_9481/g.11353 Transcript_9481/m.11353 type:complete len:227 (+) Transcript_9481:122-802(+)
MTILQNSKLTYFGIPGRGEATRLALAIGNVQFEDERIEFSNWKELKPQTPWGALPYLTLEKGQVIAHQRAILRFVGKEIPGLYPTDDHYKAAKIDELMDAVEDLGSTTMKAGMGVEDKAEKEAARKKCCEEGGPTYALLDKINTYIGTNTSPFCIGDSITIADLFVYCTCNSLVSGLFDGVPPTTLDTFDHIMAVRKSVRSHPRVIQFYKTLEESGISMPPCYGEL